jgi:2-succinyl-5-enolpyruvyl-6-hydroxy-3-cyclohexene-1-carboxylate synthase
MKAANPSHALALVVVDELARGGVTDAVLAPGSRSTALAMALHDDERLRLHVETDERSAAFLAVGLARASGRPAVVVTTSGSAVANLHPGVVEADTGRVPLVVLSADRPPELRHTGANQTIDQLKLFGDAVRHFVEVGVASDRDGEVAYWRAMVCRLLAEAQGLAGPPGPVHANLAFREPTVPLADDGRAPPAAFTHPLDGRERGRPWLATSRAPRVLADEDLAALADRLSATARGLVVTGQDTDDPEDVVGLAAALGWPVIAEPGSGARCGAAISTAHHLLSHAGFAAAHRPELVLRVGRSGISPAVSRLLADDVPQLLLDAEGAWADPDRRVAELVVADVGDTCRRLTRQVTGPVDDGWLTSWTDAERRARDILDAALDAHEQPSEPRIARDVVAHLPEGATLVAASSMPIRDLDRHAPPRSGVRVLANRGASGIDGFVSTVLGVALVEPGPVVALAGDLSLLHDANGFLLSPDAEGVDATFVVVDNDGGGIFHFLPQAGFPASFERVFGTPHGRDLADLARLHRLGYRAVERAGDLPAALDEAVEAGGVRLVHLRTDRHANVEVQRELTAAVHRALDVG